MCKFSSGHATRRSRFDEAARWTTPLHGRHADVKTNVDFWCRVMGLRFVKNTLNYETTFRYHTYFGDEDGNAGSVVTFLEFEEAPPGVPGDGDIHRLILRVGVLRLARVLDGPLHRQRRLQRAAAPRPDPAAEHRLPRPRGPRGRAHGLRHARTRRWWPTPTTSRPSTASAASRARARTRRSRRCCPFARVHGLPPRRRRAWCFDGQERSGRWYFSEPTGPPEQRRPRRRLAPHRLRRGRPEGAAGRARRGRHAARCRGRRSSTTTSSTRATR